MIIQMTTFTPLIAASAPALGRHTALLLFAPQEPKEGGQKAKVAMGGARVVILVQELKARLTPPIGRIKYESFGVNDLALKT